MFLTPEQTGGPRIFALRQHNRYLAVELSEPTHLPVIDFGCKVRAFDIRQLAKVLGQDAGETWQEHSSLILLACMGGRLFEWSSREGDVTC